MEVPANTKGRRISVARARIWMTMTRTTDQACLIMVQPNHK